MNDLNNYFTWHFFCLVYHSRSYIDAVSSVALKSMNAAVEAKANPEYPSKGEVHVCYMIVKSVP